MWALLRTYAPQVATSGAPAPRAAAAPDVFVYNVYFTSFALALVYVYATALEVAPASRLVPGILLAGAMSTGVVGTYALLATLMPRAGGDYVYVGQVLGPGWGFLASWNWVIWLCFWVGFGGYTFCTVGLRGWVVAAGLATGRADLVELARILGRSDVAFLVGTLVIGVFGLLAALGMGVYLYVQRWTFVLAVVGVGVIAYGLAAAGTEAFAASFDQAVWSVAGVGDAYAAVAGAAGEGQARAGSVFDVVPAAFLVLPWTVGSAFIGPEVRDVRRTQPRAMLAALGAVTVTAALLGALLVRAAGVDFLLGLASGAAGRIRLPLEPYLHEVAFLALRDPWTLSAAAVGYLCLGWMYVGQNVVNSARVVMAWSQDGVAPASWGEVHPRLHVPWRGTWVVMALSELFLAVVCFAPLVQLLSSILALSLSAALACLSAVLLPWRRPALLRGPAARRVLRVPLLVWAGACGLLVLSYVDLRYLLDARYGTAKPESLAAVATVVALGASYRRWAVKRWGRS